jgi:hypothetical protein
MWRKLFTLVAAISFALLLFIFIMWVRSYVTKDLQSFFTPNKWETLVSSKRGVVELFGSWAPDEADKHPVEIMDYSVSYWVLALVAGLLPAAWVRFRLPAIIRRRVHSERQKRQQCPNCGYDLRATPDRCPECGAVRGPASQAAP